MTLLFHLLFKSPIVDTTPHYKIDQSGQYVPLTLNILPYFDWWLSDIFDFICKIAKEGKITISQAMRP